MTVISILAAFTIGLILLSGWAMRERKNATEVAEFARQQADSALVQKERALLSQEMAEKANRDAGKQRAKALVQASIAKNARDEALRAKNLAERRRYEADSLKTIAELNLQDAEWQRAVADMAKHDAEEQARIAREANDSATRLYSVAMSNAMAMRAKSEYGDKKLNLRIAYTAYLLNKRNNVTQNNAELYDAMLYSMEINNLVKPLKTTNETVVAFTIDLADRIILLTEHGRIIGYNVLDRKAKEFVNISDFVSHDQIHNAIFLSPELIIYSTVNKETFCININQRWQKKLSLQGDYVKSAMLTPDGRFFVAAYNNGRIGVFDSDDPDEKPEANLNLKTTIADIYCYGKSDVYLLTRNATLKRWNFRTNISQEIFSQAEVNAYAMTCIESKKLLAICFSKGDIQFLDLKTGTKESDMLGAHNRIEKIVYDNKSKYIAMSSLGNRISIINSNHINSKPLVVDDFLLHNFPVKNICFDSYGTMFVLTEENVIRYFESDITVYADFLSSLKVTELSQQEYSLILGQNFSSK